MAGLTGNPLMRGCHAVHGAFDDRPSGSVCNIGAEPLSKVLPVANHKLRPAWTRRLVMGYLEDLTTSGDYWFVCVPDSGTPAEVLRGLANVADDSVGRHLVPIRVRQLVRRAQVRDAQVHRSREWRLARRVHTAV